MVYKFFNSLKNSKSTFKRFPVVMILSFILSLNLIYSVNHMGFSNSSIIDNIARNNIILFLAILLSILISLINEQNANFKSRTRKLLPYILAIVLLSIYYFIFLKNINNISIAKSIGLFIALFITIFIVQGIEIQKNYEFYVFDLIKAVLTGVLYSTILFLGLFFILFTLRNLFEILVPDKIYMYIFILSYIPVLIFVSLSKIPKLPIDYRDKQVNKVYLLLMRYIVIPLIYIYTTILYLYFLKVIASWTWPKGLVSHLVIWYSLFTVGILFFFQSEYNDHVVNNFVKKFPKLLIPILLMMFFSIGQRVMQYGITENRYYLITVGLWIFMVTLYYGFKKEIINIFIPISLVIVILISQFGPFSSYSLSKRSQSKRLENLLIKTGILEGKSFKKKYDVLEENQIEISNIIYYFDKNHNIKDIKFLPENFEIDNMILFFGFKYNPDIGYIFNNEDRFYYSMELKNEILDIKAYDYLGYMKSYDEEKLKIDNLEISYNIKSNSLIIVDKITDVTKEINLDLDVRTIHTSQLNEDYIKKYEEMVFEHLIPSFYNIKIIYLNVDGTINNENILKLNNLDFLLLFNRL